MPKTRQKGQGAGEPYKLAYIFVIIPQYNGNQIFFNTFMCSYNTALDMAVGKQQLSILTNDFEVESQI